MSEDAWPGRARRIAGQRLWLLVGMMLCVGMLFAQSTAPTGTTTAKKKTAPKKASSTRSAAHSGKTTGRGAKSAARPARRAKKKPLTVAEKARTARLRSAFVASAQLRPMAQQLASTRTAAAYAGVLGYAQGHTGEASSAAYLALGHAYLLDRRFADAANSFHTANTRGDALRDYTDYLEATADLQAGRGADADAILETFAAKHPDSIFAANIPVMLANAYMEQGNAGAALRVLGPLQGTERGAHSDAMYALGRAYQLSGNAAEAGVEYRWLYLSQPLSAEAANARTQMEAVGAAPLTLSERRAHADKLFAAKRYTEAMEDFETLAREGGSAGDPDAGTYEVYAAACRLKLKMLKKGDAERLPDSNGDSGALRLYLIAETARDSNDFSSNEAALQQMRERFPQSKWLNDALYSAGNMYLLKRDYAQAIGEYMLLVELFPASTYAPSSHWRAAWLNYRLRNYSEAARLFDEQIQKYEGGIEIPNALYWRGRIYEDEERNIGQAENYYRALAGTYTNYYYALLARERMSALPAQSAPQAAALSHVRPLSAPELTDQLPEDDIHLIKARLLANAALNEYIAPEIQASEDSPEWGAYAQSQIYASYGEYSRALQTMKQAKIPFFALPVNEVPMSYWRLLFPQPYWGDLSADAEKNGLDPYLVASLIRQESEFNAGAVSRANAYGLMQLLPSVGKQMAKKEKERRFDAAQLLNPQTNLDLGTENLRIVLSRFGGQVEYALAAYNAGDDRVRDWESNGEYKDMPEFVESIPFTETRDYVQAIVRNREMYRIIYSEGQSRR